MAGTTEHPDDREPDPPLRNPFRSEADAFRLLLIVGAAVAVAAGAFALAGPWLGLPVALFLLALGTRAAYRWARVGLSDPDALRGPHAPRR